MPRLLFTSLVFLISFSSFSQRKHILEGKYSINYGLGFESLNFLDSIHFEYTSFMCTEGCQGKGIYKGKRGKLKLTFLKDSTSTTHFQKSIYIKEKMKDEINDTLVLRGWESQEPAIGVILYVNHKGVKEYATLSDVNGRVSFKYHANSDSILITTKALTYDSCSFKLPGDKCATVHLSLNKRSYNHCFKNGEVKTYKIRKRWTSHLEIRRGKGPTAFRKPAGGIQQ
jgi:hypothetical protein